MRPQVTVGELVRFLSQCPDDLPVFCAPSTVNEDELEATQEFIEDDEKIKCVVIETSVQYATIGWAA